MALLPILCGGLLAADRLEAQQADAPARLITVSSRAEAIHRRGFVFDGHNDLPWQIRTRASQSFDRLDIAQEQPDLHTDIPRLRAGGVGAVFWSVYVPASTDQTGVAHQMTLEQIEIVHAMVRRYPQTFALASTVSDVEQARQAGKIASLIGVEGGHAIENSLEKLRRLYQLGARYMTLTHSQSLDWADSCSDEPRCGGLSEFGKEVVREMNRLGMLVDLSHVSPATMQSALDTSVAPVIFSHSSARAVADHPRNVPDEILRQLPANGGVVMVNFYSGFVVPESANNTRTMFELERQWAAEFGDDEEAIRRARAAYRARYPILRGSVHHVADHIDHIVKVAGVDHVGLGSDYDGIGTVPEQLEDVSKYPVLTQVLLDRGYREEDIQKILSGNIMRVMRQAEAAARRIQAAQN
ncbi:MAG: dipeptidase [Pirellulaceae bacterium]|nr:MAG: dipeptidase [Pirellulaceae bacterium]